MNDPVCQLLYQRFAWPHVRIAFVHSSSTRQGHHSCDRSRQPQLLEPGPCMSPRGLELSSCRKLVGERIELVQSRDGFLDVLGGDID
jgi:hypothetical protein